jgi:hypothetical protein
MTNQEAIKLLSMGRLAYNEVEAKAFCEAYNMAIEALKKEPCEDAISRQAVLDAIEELKKIHFDRGVVLNKVRDRVLELPSVTPQPNKWIPCSERLPNFAGVYLVTRYFPNNVMNPTYLVDACFFDGTDTWHNDNRINHDRKYLTNVVAWLEEPEPFKEIPTGAEGSDEE